MLYANVYRMQRKRRRKQINKKIDQLPNKVEGMNLQNFHEDIVKRFKFKLGAESFCDLIKSCETLITQIVAEEDESKPTKSNREILGYILYKIIDREALSEKIKKLSQVEKVEVRTFTTNEVREWIFGKHEYSNKERLIENLCEAQQKLDSAIKYNRLFDQKLLELKRCDGCDPVERAEKIASTIGFLHNAVKSVQINEETRARKRTKTAKPTATEDK
mmetsp:Transcript_7799/g.14513  ORF Transcript_7799/g.14513 Transcript_7799/m.14513 type:complete len:218 (-) Transcript_7799:86-739(-)